MTFEEALVGWLPGQRWFAGKGAPIDRLAIDADTVLVDGDPALRHLIVAVSQAGGTDHYQLLAGLRTAIPDRLEHAVIGPAGDAGELGPGWTVYDALHDPQLTRRLLQAMAGGETIGQLSFAAEPDAVIDTGLDSLVLTGEQSNTSMIFGEEAILKVFRRPHPGPNPDLEIPRYITAVDIHCMPTGDNGSLGSVKALAPDLPLSDWCRCQPLDMTLGSLGRHMKVR